MGTIDKYLQMIVIIIMVMYLYHILLFLFTYLNIHITIIIKTIYNYYIYRFSRIVIIYWFNNDNILDYEFNIFIYSILDLE